MHIAIIVIYFCTPKVITVPEDSVEAGPSGILAQEGVINYITVTFLSLTPIYHYSPQVTQDHPMVNCDLIYAVNSFVHSSTNLRSWSPQMTVSTMINQERTERE